MSHGMCRATLGARAVYLCTCAASAIFSKGSRGVPGVPNTRKRVPELPYAQLATSICSFASCSCEGVMAMIAPVSFDILRRCANRSRRARACQHAGPCFRTQAQMFRLSIEHLRFGFRMRTVTHNTDEGVLVVTRDSRILDALDQHGTVQVAELARELGVSEVTI